MRHYARYILLPVHFSKEILSNSFSATFSYISNQNSLLDETQEQKETILELKAQLMGYNALQKEYDRLSRFVSLKENDFASLDFQVSRIVSVVNNSNLKRVFINKGEVDGIKVGQPVLSYDAVVGQIIDVMPGYSEILFVTDPIHALPVLNERTGDQFIAEGTTNINFLRVVVNTPNHNFEVEDIILTSGLGQAFPRNYPVGTVDRIENRPERNETHIWVSTFANFSDIDLVGIYLLPEATKPDLYYIK